MSGFKTTLFSLVVLSIGLIIYRLPHTSDPVSYYIAPVKPFPAGTKISKGLSSAEQISIDPFRGPESFVCHNGSLFTGVADGTVLKVSDSRVNVFTILKDTNGNRVRPLGMRLSTDSTHLLVVSTTSGVYSISLLDGVYKEIWPFTSKFLDDIDLLPNGDFIISEVTSHRPVEEAFIEYLEAKPHGRLLYVNGKTGEWRKLLDGIYFANGVQLHRDGKSLLVAETTTCRVLRVPLDGSPPTVFADGLLGHPDNIRLSQSGGYWVPVSNLRVTSFSTFIDWTAKWPKIRIILIKLLQLPVFEQFRLTRSAALLRLDENGKIVEAIMDPENRIANVAEVCECDGYLYTSSYFLPFIGRLKMTG